MANEVDLSSKDIESWEKNPKSVSKLGLSSLAYYYGLSSEELLDAIYGDSSKLTSSEYFIYGGKDYEDGWWGHLGIRLNGHEKSKWFPITLGEANRISSAVVNISSRDKWIVIQTLNNRVLAFKPAKVNRLWLLDEAADQPGDDWEIPWDGYSGKPGEFYKGLEQYFWGAEGLGDDEVVCDRVMKDV